MLLFDLLCGIHDKTVGEAMKAYALDENQAVYHSQPRWKLFNFSAGSFCMNPATEQRITRKTMSTLEMKTCAITREFVEDNCGMSSKKNRLAGSQPMNIQRGPEIEK